MKLELVSECWQCDGNEEILDKKAEQWIPCPQCNGKGFIIESDGHIIIEFMEKVFGIKPK